LFNICQSTGFQAERLADDALEGIYVPHAGPQLELDIARGSKLQQCVLTAILQLDGGNRLRVAAVEIFGELQHRRQRANHATPLPLEIAEAFMPSVGGRPPMVAGDQRNDIDFVRFEPAQIAVLNQIVRVFVVPLVADMDADIVQQRRIFQPFALAIGQTVHAARVIEQHHRETCHLLRMVGPVVAALRQLDDAAATDVRVAIGLDDLLAVTRDVVETQAFSER
jgi:hypothetical protein